MSADTVIGHRCGAGRHTRQYPGLDTSGAVADLSELQGQFVKIAWLPTVPAASAGVLFYGFFADETAANAGFDAATSSDASGDDPIMTAPEFIERGKEQVIVPQGLPWLRVEASLATGRCTVSESDQDRSDNR